MNACLARQLSSLSDAFIRLAPPNFSSAKISTDTGSGWFSLESKGSLRYPIDIAHLENSYFLFGHFLPPAYPTNTFLFFTVWWLAKTQFSQKQKAENEDETFHLSKV
jgi:hypothetical protein